MGMEIKFNNQMTFGQLECGDIFALDTEETRVYMKINDKAATAVNLLTGNPAHFCSTDVIIPLRGTLEVTKI